MSKPGNQTTEDDDGQESSTTYCTCPQCGAVVPPTFKFCGACGYSMENVPESQQSERPKRQGAMVRILPDGTESGVHELVQGENLLGRQHGSIFEDDGYVSPTHAMLLLEGKTARVRDLDSLNGIYVRIIGDEEIVSGQHLRVGQELLRFDEVKPPQAHADGTEIMGSPNPGYWGKLAMIVGPGREGAVYPLANPAVTLGRERGDINFPGDGYVSGLHAKISLKANGKMVVSDMHSSNGTFLQVLGERALAKNAILLMGQQLFRLRIS